MGLLEDGWAPRRVTVALLVVLWSLRLGLYLWGRVAARHPQEDPRYAVLAPRVGNPISRSPFWDSRLARAVLVWLLTLPVYLICRNARFSPKSLGNRRIRALAARAGRGGIGRMRN